MSKKLTKGAVATALVGLVSVGQQIHAEEVSSVTHSVPNTEVVPTTEAVPSTTQAQASTEAPTTATPTTATPEVATTTSETTTTEIAKETVDEARKQSDDANTKVEAQKEVVSEKEQTKSEADKAVADQEKEVAKKKELKDEATPEKIASEKEKAKELEKKESDSKKAVEDAKTDLASKEEKQKVAKDKADAQEKKVQDATATRDQKQDAVNKAQKALDGTDEGKALKALEQAEAVKKDKEAKVTSKESELEYANDHDNELNRQKQENASELAKAKSSKATADATLKSATETNARNQSALTKAQTDKTNAEVALKEATKTDNFFDDANPHVREYSQIMREMYGGSRSLSVTEFMSKYKRLGELSKLIKKELPYKSDESLSRVVDVLNMSEADKLRFEKYAEDLQNQVRDVFGSGRSVYNKEMRRFTEEVARGYEADRHSVFGVSAEADRLQKAGAKPNEIPIGHDAYAINRVAKKYGLPVSKGQSEKMGGQYYENLYTTSDARTKLTVNEIYQRIFNTFSGFMFNGYEYDHAKSIADVSSTTKAGDTNYAGIAFSVTPDTTTNGRRNEFHVHVLGVKKSLLEHRTTPREREFDTTVSPNPIDTLKANLKKANDALTTAQQNAKTSADALKRATDNVKSLTERITALTEQKARLDKESLLAPKAQKALAEAHAELSKAVAQVQTAQQDVDRYRASIAEKTKALNEAKAELKTAQDSLAKEEAERVVVNSALDEANKAVEDQKARIAELTETHQSAVFEVEKQAKYIEDLEKADENYQSAVTKLETLKTVAEKANEALKEATKVLAELQEKATTLQTEADDLEAKYNAQEEEKARLRRVEEERIAEENRLAEYDSIIDSVEPVSAKELPNTGVQKSDTTVAGVILALLGFGFVPRKKRNEEN